VHGTVADNGGTAGVNLSTGGFAGGIDGSLGGWRSGLMVQAGGTSTQVSGLGSSSDSTDYGAGVYGGRQWGNIRLSLGAIYTRHDFRATRDVAFAGFTDDLSATYSAGTAQAFGKLSQEFDFGAVALRPYASLDYVNHDSDGFTETGGAAALSSAANVVDATFTTLGFGVDRKFLIGDGMLLTAKGSLGWRHAFADTPSSNYRLAGGPSFSVVGAPIASDTAVVSAGLNLDVDPGNTFVVGYEGQIGDGTELHALEGVWSMQF
jgi:outer membrane autotransporter protein